MEWGTKVAAVSGQAQTEVQTTPELCGTYRHHIDEKGRVAIPAQLRRHLPEGSVVAPGPEGRLMIWPPAAWAIQKELFQRTAETPAQQRRFLRVLSGNTYPFELDAQGRLLLSARQRAFAGIGDAVVFVGLGEAVEITADHIWQSEQPELDANEFTQLWDLVHQRGTSASSSPA